MLLNFQMVINSFSICDGEMNPVGVGLYLGWVPLYELNVGWVPLYGWYMEWVPCIDGEYSGMIDAWG